MAVLILLTPLIALDLAAWRWGHDSRDGHDWRFLSSTDLPAWLSTVGRSTSRASQRWFTTCWLVAMMRGHDDINSTRVWARRGGR